jgi:hypothetical protein
MPTTGCWAIAWVSAFDDGSAVAKRDVNYITRSAYQKEILTIELAVA